MYEPCFEYKNDSVVVVEKWAYYHCNSSNPISVFNDGNTLITLEKSGPIFFISGDPDHCQDGQRLFIDVLQLHPAGGSHNSPPVIPDPPQPDSPGPSPLPNSGIKIFSNSVFSVSMAASTAAAFLLFMIA